MGDDAVIDFENSDIKISELRSASKLRKEEYESLVEQNKTPYPNNFDQCIIYIGDESSVTGEVPDDLVETDCVCLEQQEEIQELNAPKPKRAKRGRSRPRKRSSFCDWDLIDSDSISVGVPYDITVTMFGGILVLMAINFLCVLYYCYNRKSRTYKVVSVESDSEMDALK